MRYTAKSDDVSRLPLGASLNDKGCNFAVYAPHADEIYIHIFDKEDHETLKFKLGERKGGIWYGFAEGIKAGDCYAIEAIGPDSPAEGNYYKRGRLLVDPYAQAISKPFVFDKDLYENHSERFIPKAIIHQKHDDFDWQGVQKPVIHRAGVIIYEAHVKGMTKLCDLIPEEIRGTYLGLAHPVVINHLKKLGITVVQLMPVSASMSEPELTERGMSNYWGYNPVCFMAPDPRYAVDPFKVKDEFRTMVRELHRNGIGVIMDVVYNHTAEGGYGGPVLSLKGLDNKDYYAFEDNADGTPNYTRYRNVSGCGNSFNTDNKVGLNLVTDSLIYWLEEMQVDGFRFDLGVTLCRESHGSQRFEFDSNAGFLKTCYCNERINGSILIAEPWDIGPGGYRLGQFTSDWSEQNDRFRDTVRRFWRGDKGNLGDFATRVMGSRDIFRKGMRSINASVNYVTYHDGFTLEDLVSYNGKHNEANGYGNTDGTSENFSTNCGVEGPSDDPMVQKYRWQLKRNLIATVLLSQGTPHLLYGDEFSRTQQGNNNAYCQDNEMNYMKWDYSEKNKQFIEFISRFTWMRRNSVLLSELVLEDDSYHIWNNIFMARWYMPNGIPMTSDRWNDPDKKAIMLFAGTEDINIGEQWILLFNNTTDDIFFTLPDTPAGKKWSVAGDSSEPDGIPDKYSNTNGLESVCAGHSTKILLLVDDDAPPLDEAVSELDDIIWHSNRPQNKTQAYVKRIRKTATKK